MHPVSSAVLLLGLLAAPAWGQSLDALVQVVAQGDESENSTAIAEPTQPAASSPPIAQPPPETAAQEPTAVPSVRESAQIDNLAKQGLQRLAAGDYLEAADQLRTVLRHDPSLTNVRYALGQALFNLGDLDEAIDEYRRVLRDRPTMTHARVHLATTLMAKRQWKDAQKELLTVLAQDPKAAAAHHNLATVRYSQGDVRGAIEAYRAALAVAPNSAETHYHLGVVLRLAGRTKEAVIEFEAAAEAGHAKAQYFLGNAYSTGAGVDRDLPAAIRWWITASEHGVPEAQDALSRLRKAALKPASAKEPNKTLKAFRAYCEDLWNEFPELTRNGTDETVGVTLLQALRTREAIPTLIRESIAMSDLSERYLAALYEEGLAPSLLPHDGRILRYFETAAEDGAPQARLALARIHALGLGVPADRSKALAIIKGLPTGYAEQFLQDLATRPAGSSPQTTQSSSNPSSAAP